LAAYAGDSRRGEAPAEVNMATQTAARPARDPVADADNSLVLEHVTAGYGSGPAVVDDISFTIHRGERVAVVGPNGAGKSTLFQVIVGLLPHRTGDVLVHGHSHHAGDCPSIGYVPQREAVDWSFPLSVFDVVLMGRLKAVGWLRRPGRQDRAAARQALEQAGLDGLAGHPIADLSGGQQQRVFIARALAQRADVLLLDEPFGGVDVEAQAAIFAILDHLREQQVTVLISTHDLQTATTRFNRLLLLNGRILADGPAESILTPERLAAAYGGRLTIWKDGQPVTVSTDECCP
jgi:ABC-type Mn2+/Zn2+ transport system ATPase subunit